MRSIVLGYGVILITLIIGSALLIRITSSGPNEQVIAAGEGKLISLDNYIKLLTKNLDQSIEFISQRVAYDLGKKGGMIKEIYWTEAYPTIDILERNLENAIVENLPSETISGTRTVNWGQGEVNIEKYNVFPCGAIHDSSCFFVNGSKYITIYDKPTDSKVVLNPHRFFVRANSNYFKLLNASRTIMEVPPFSQNLDDIGTLLNDLYAAKVAGDVRFNDLDFEIKLKDEIIQIQNPGFETGFTSWSRILGALGENIDSAFYRSGSKSYHIIQTTAKSGSTVRCQQFTITPGEYYTAKVWTKTGDGKNGILYLTTNQANYGECDTYTSVRKICIDGSVVELSQDCTVGVPPPSWFQVSVTCKSITSNVMYVCMGAETTTTASIWFDDVKVYKGENVKETDVVEVMITENCYPPKTYCLSPIKEGETGINDPLGNPVPYDVNRFKFQYIKGQTGLTPTNFDFDVDIFPNTKAIKSGEFADDIIVNVNKLGAGSNSVSLSYTIFPNDPSITVSFNPSSGFPSYSSVMNISTTSMTMSGLYAITIIAKQGTIQKTATLSLTINPSMSFSMDLTSDNGKIDKGKWVTTNVKLNLIGGSSSNVVLEALNKPSGCTVTFKPPNCIPTCSPDPVMNISTSSTINPGIYHLTVKATGGGNSATHDYYLTIAQPFDFEMSFLSSDATIVNGSSTGTYVYIKLPDPSMLSKTVSLSYSITPNEPTINVGFSPTSLLPKNPPDSSTITISSSGNTPEGTYPIKIIGTATDGTTHYITFSLTVKYPRCYGPEGCNDGNYCSKDQCILPGTPDAFCNNPPEDNTFVPPDGSCETIQAQCPDKCSFDKEYTNGSIKTCSITCDGDEARCGTEHGCVPPSCTNSDYSTIKDCRFGCDGRYCHTGLYCPPYGGRYFQPGKCGDSNNDLACNSGTECFTPGTCISSDNIGSTSPVLSCSWSDDFAEFPFCILCCGHDRNCDLMVGNCTSNDACKYKPYCGDGICDTDTESYSNCPGDCPCSFYTYYGPLTGLDNPTTKCDSFSDYCAWTGSACVSKGGGVG